MASWDVSPTEPARAQHESAPNGSIPTSTTTDAISGASGGAGVKVGDGRLEAPTPASLGSNPQNQVVLILCGLIASGKSTFAEQLEQHFPEFTRCNQDDLGDRRRVEQLARESLAAGLSVCIDRANFDASQRFHWIKIGREFPGTQIWVIVFDTPYEVCAARLKERTGHPTITDVKQGLSVLSRFAFDFQHPRDHEGHERILYLNPSDHATPEYTRADISAILERVSQSTREAEAEVGVICILSNEAGDGVEEDPQTSTVIKRERPENKFNRTEALGKEVECFLSEDGVIVETRLEVAQTCNELG